MPQGTAEFSFTQGTTRKLGNVNEGEKIFFSYPFVNKGTSSLVISDARVACACTVVDYPKLPIAPGEKSEIKVTFDTRGKIGYQDRTIEVFSNARKNPVKLRFKVMVNNS